MQEALTSSSTTASRPKVLIIGGEDVDARIELMRGLATSFRVAAAGTAPGLEPRFAREGLPYFCYPLSRGVGPAADVRSFVALLRLLGRHRPHVVHSFDTKPGVYACLAARLIGVPVIVGTVTGLGSLYGEAGGGPPMVRGVYERLQRVAAQYADRTVFQNRDDRDEFVARRVVPAAKAVVIAGSGVPTERFDPARVPDHERRAVRDALGIPAGAPLVTMVSRVIRSKGVAEFAAAARLVRRMCPDARFILVGRADTDSVDQLSDVELARVTQAVQWLGPRSDIPQLLAASDLFVLPSYLREGVPRALLEAAAMGLPLIATDTPGCNDVVHDSVNGRLIQPRDHVALARAIVELLERPDVCAAFGHASRRRAVGEFDIAVVTDQTRRLYTELLERKARTSPALRSALSVA